MIGDMTDRIVARLMQRNSMQMTVISIDGKWFVGDILAGPFNTNEQAWRWIDRREGDHAQARSEGIPKWLWDQAASGK